MNKESKVRLFVAFAILALVLFVPMSWNVSISQLNVWWKVIVYIIVTGAGTLLVYWPRGSKLSDIKKTDMPHIMRDYALVALITLILFGIVIWYIGSTA